MRRTRAGRSRAAYRNITRVAEERKRHIADINRAIRSADGTKRYPWWPRNARAFNRRAALWEGAPLNRPAQRNWAKATTQLSNWEGQHHRQPRLGRDSAGGTGMHHGSTEVQRSLAAHESQEEPPSRAPSGESEFQAQWGRHSSSASVRFGSLKVAVKVSDLSHRAVRGHLGSVRIRRSSDTIKAS